MRPANNLPDPDRVQQRIEGIVLEATIDGPAGDDWHRYEHYKRLLQRVGLESGDPRYDETIGRLAEVLAL